MARELLKGENQFEELTPEFLKSVFSSEAFFQRMRTLYNQQTKRKIPFKEQRFHIQKPLNNQFYVFPLESIKNSPSDISKGSMSFFHGLKELLAQPFKPGNEVLLSPIIIIAHTHPSWTMSSRFTGKEPMIIPSAYDEKLKKGDLYLFLQLRAKAVEDIVARRPIQIIIAQGIHSQFPIELLFIQETDRLLADNPEDILPDLIKIQKEYFHSVRSQEEVIAVLSRMRYQACHIALSKDNFISQRLFSGEDLEKIRQFAY